MGGAVADEHRGEHIHGGVFQLGQCHLAALLAGAANAAHHAAKGTRPLAVLQQDANRLLQVIRPPFGGGIVQRHAEIPHGGAGQPLFDHLPRSQPVRKGDHAEIMGQRCAQHGGTA